MEWQDETKPDDHPGSASCCDRHGVWLKICCEMVKVCCKDLHLSLKQSSLMSLVVLIVHFRGLPSMKLTYPLKLDSWNTSFLWGWPIFRGYVHFFEGNMMFFYPISSDVFFMIKHPEFAIGSWNEACHPQYMERSKDWSQSPNKQRFLHDYWLIVFLSIYMGVSENSGTPKSSDLIGCSFQTIHFGIPLFLETPI